MPQTPIMSQLLPELLDSVLEQLDGDKATLSACSLVSKSDWLESSRHHLFRQLTIDGTSRYGSATVLAEFLRSTPSVAKHVRELSLVDLKLISQGKIQPPLRSDTLADILSSLPMLESLELENLMWECTDHASSASPGGRRPLFRLKMLSLSRLVLLQDPPRSLLDLLQLYSHLDELRLEGIWAESIYQAPLLLGKATPSISSLHVATTPTVNAFTLLDSKCNGVMLKFIRQTFMLSAIQELDVVCMSWEDVDALQTFLRDVGRNLRDLRLDLSQLYLGDEDPSFWNVLNLAPCTSLRSLHFHIFMNFRQRVPGGWSWRSTMDVLATAGKSLQSLSLGMEILSARRTYQSFDHIDWPKFEELTTNLPGLCMVTFARVSGRRGNRAFAKYEVFEGPRDVLEPRLPKLAKNGMLQWRMSPPGRFKESKAKSRRRGVDSMRSYVAPSHASAISRRM